MNKLVKMDCETCKILFDIDLVEIEGENYLRPKYSSVVSKGEGYVFCSKTCKNLFDDTPKLTKDNLELITKAFQDSFKSKKLNRDKWTLENLEPGGKLSHFPEDIKIKMRKELEGKLN